LKILKISIKLYLRSNPTTRRIDCREEKKQTVNLFANSIVHNTGEIAPKMQEG